VIAGGIAGGIEISITYPTGLSLFLVLSNLSEYVKTIMQLYEKESKKGPLQVVRDTVKTNGITGIYRG
jgi:hypothetical protein